MGVIYGQAIGIVRSDAGSTTVRRPLSIPPSYIIYIFLILFTSVTSYLVISQCDWMLDTQAYSAAYFSGFAYGSHRGIKDAMHRSFYPKYASIWIRGNVIAR